MTVALNAGMGSSYLNAEVNALDSWPVLVLLSDHDRRAQRSVAASYGHAARSCPLARGRAVELGRAGARRAYWGTAIAEPARDQHLTVRKERGDMVGASAGHAACGSPGI